MQPREGTASSVRDDKTWLIAHACNSEGHSVPLVISLLSARPPQREMAMEGKSRIPSEVLSTPLSAPELPTDCGDWLVRCSPASFVFLLWTLSPLEKKNQEFSLHVFLPKFAPFNKHCSRVTKKKKLGFALKFEQNRIGLMYTQILDCFYLLV